MSLDAEYFDGLYERRDDPWRLAERWYERRKRALTLAMLPRERFASALEVGCSIGTLTAELAPRCSHLLATDISPRAVSLARERLAGVDTVEFMVMDAPTEWPEQHFDLIVLSEVGYYLDEENLTRLVARCVDSLDEDGVLVACHWRHPVADYPLGGDRTQAIIASESGLARVAAYVDDDVRLELFARSPGSVAQHEGLL